MFAHAVGALSRSDAGVLHVAVFLTFNASNRNSHILADIYQVILDPDTSGEELVGGLWTDTRDF
jgi:hypothetical protein